MAAIRKPLQGTRNIIRFNRHFYLLALVCISAGIALYIIKPGTFTFSLLVLSLLVVAATLVSLAVSMYIYDFSGLYTFAWLHKLKERPHDYLVNIHAGFDETSTVISDIFHGRTLAVFDFYDPKKHTEVSVRRARKAYPAFPGTTSMNTHHIPLPDQSVDLVFLIFAAHEIRNQPERNVFFGEVRRILRDGGTVIVTEHLRDFPNFMAYNFGFFHFQSEKTWLTTFAGTGFSIREQFRHTPFIKTYILSKNGDTIKNSR